MGLTMRQYRECKRCEFDNLVASLIHRNHSHIAVCYIRRAQLFGASNNLLMKAIGSFFINRLIIQYGIYVHPDTEIGVGLKLPHPNGIVIGSAVVIGEHATIYQQVTIGSSRIGDWKKAKQPHIGNGVIIFSGAKIIGDIKICNNVTIGANAVITKPINDPGSTWVGIPAHML